MGLEVKTSEEFSRSGTVKDLDTAAHFQDGFKLPDGSVFGPILLSSGTVIAKVIAHTAPDMSGMQAERAKIRDEIKTQRARERDTLFETGVKDMLIKQGKIKIHQDVINRLIGNYRTS